MYSYIKKISLIFLVLGVFSVFPVQAHAEVIKYFSVALTVNTDASLQVSESITYDFEAQQRHGIIRVIPLRSSEYKKIRITDVSIVDAQGSLHPFIQSEEDDTLILKVGDPSELISGTHQYVFSYTVDGAIASYENYDELYWNATGDAWGVPIQKAHAVVRLPNGATISQQACYVGVQGSTTPCISAQDGVFSSETLQEGEGLTVAVGFPKGVVVVPVKEVDSAGVAATKKYWPLGIPLVVFIYMYLRWSKKGKDPKGTGVIIPQYDVPDGVTPLEVNAIIDQGANVGGISAEIIYLATKGYIKISYENTSYSFTLLKVPENAALSFDVNIIKAIFGESPLAGRAVSLASLRSRFYLQSPEIIANTNKSILEKGYYTNISAGCSHLGSALVFMFGICIAIVIGATLFSDSLLLMSYLVVCFIAIVLTSTILVVFMRSMSAKSQKGVAIYEYLLGLKEYLQIAEKDRLNFHNAPEKKPELFEALLPYAMVFGVETLWAKEFKDLYITPPSWYSSPEPTFDVVVFGHQMNQFSTLAFSSFSGPKNSGGSSGSDGGGFSGGGGGGGGGRSW